MAPDSFYNRTADFYAEPMATQDASGGIVIGEVASLLGVRCCISTITEVERSMYGSRGVDASHYLFCNPRYRGLLDETMKVVAGADRFDVQTIENPQHRNSHLKLVVLEVKGNGAVT